MSGSGQRRDCFTRAEIITRSWEGWLPCPAIPGVGWTGVEYTSRWTGAVAGVEASPFLQCACFEDTHQFFQ